MSILSPTKQERIERHLMRQRGAGTRTISGTFGFAFGSSAPTSNEATPISVEPAAKRRKTLLANDIGATGESADLVGKIGNGSGGGGIKNVKGEKSRKRWPPEFDVGSIARSYPKAEDDSFIRTAKAGLKKQNKREATKQHADAGLGQPAKRGRLRRNAATKAAIKVADDLEEERRPVDKKRRPDEPDVKLTKSNRRKQKQDGPIEVIEVPSRTTNASKADVSSRHKEAGAKSSVREAIEEITPLERHPAKGICDHEEELEPATKVRTSRKRKQREEVAALAAEVELEDTRHTNTTNPVDRQAGVALASSTILQPPAAKPRKNASGEPTVAQKANAKGAQQSLRAPLEESDANVTLRSTSPEKPIGKKREADLLDMKVENTSAKCVEQENIRPTKRRKVQVRQDDEVLEKKTKDTTTPSDLAQLNSRIDIEAATKRDNQMRTAASAISKIHGAMSFKRKKQQEHLAAEHEPVAQERDIDWLFQSLPTKQQPPVPRKQPTVLRKGPRTPKKLVDIDLDDLLSNIASFAKMENQACVGVGHDVHMKATKAANGVHSKRKR